MRIKWYGDKCVSKESIESMTLVKRRKALAQVEQNKVNTNRKFNHDEEEASLVLKNSVTGTGSSAKTEDKL